MSILGGGGLKSNFQISQEGFDLSPAQTVKVISTFVSQDASVLLKIRAKGCIERVSSEEVLRRAFS